MFGWNLKRTKNKPKKKKTKTKKKPKKKSCAQISMQKYMDICAQLYKVQTHPSQKMTEAYEIDEAFKQLIIECGRALNTLELVI